MREKEREREKRSRGMGSLSSPVVAIVFVKGWSTRHSDHETIDEECASGRPPDIRPDPRLAPS